MTSDLIAEFKECLSRMSYARAGWDYELSPEERTRENALEKNSLSRARAIWGDNPDAHEVLRAAFVEASPLATLKEITQ